MMPSALPRAVLIACALALAPPAVAQTGEHRRADAAEPRRDVLEVAAATGQLTRSLAAVEAAGYAETLRGEGPFTIFAPTDEAFRRMDRRELERLMQPRQREELLALLAYHVVPERVTVQSVGGRVTRPESASGYRVTLDGRDGLRINDQLVVMPDIDASNGVIHGVNSVLAPPVVVASR